MEQLCHQDARSLRRATAAQALPGEAGLRAPSFRYGSIWSSVKIENGDLAR